MRGVHIYNIQKGCSTAIVVIEFMLNKIFLKKPDPHHSTKKQHRIEKEKS